MQLSKKKIDMTGTGKSILIHLGIVDEEGEETEELAEYSC